MPGHTNSGDSSTGEVARAVGRFCREGVIVRRDVVSVVHSGRVRVAERPSISGDEPRGILQASMAAYCPLNPPVRAWPYASTRRRANATGSVFSPRMTKPQCHLKASGATESRRSRVRSSSFLIAICPSSRRAAHQDRSELPVQRQDAGSVCAQGRASLGPRTAARPDWPMRG